jgi:hypothetical protein
MDSCANIFSHSVNEPVRGFSISSHSQTSSGIVSREKKFSRNSDELFSNDYVMIADGNTFCHNVYI